MELDVIVNLNVGGKVYTTSRSTLTRFPDSMLSAMFRGELSTKTDRHGNVFIDRDGELFRFVLNFLRNSKLVLPQDFKELSLLAIEADFYQITEFSDAVNIAMSAEYSQQCPVYEYVELQRKGSYFRVFMSESVWHETSLLFQELTKRDDDANDCTEGQATMLSEHRVRLYDRGFREPKIAWINGKGLRKSESPQISGDYSNSLRWMKSDDGLKLTSLDLKRDILLESEDTVVVRELNNMEEPEKILLYTELSRLGFQLITSSNARDSGIDVEMRLFKRSVRPVLMMDYTTADIALQNVQQ
ncbi:uncharacterized protein LOC144359381 [Saccoglossus kowalevskii]